MQRDEPTAHARRGRGHEERADRAQTLNDFTIGMGLFIIAVGFVFFMIPTIIAPYYSPGESGTQLRAERSAGHLVNNLLAGDASLQSGTLDAECTVAFFRGVDEPGCPYDGTSLETAFGLREVDTVNVTIRKIQADEVIARDGPDADSDPTKLRRGPAIPENSDVAVWTRLVHLDGHTRRLTVQVW